jgi:hypothetical protein
MTMSTKMVTMAGPAAFLPQQRHQQWHAHKAGVGKRPHQGAKGGVVPADASVQGHRHHKAHHHQGTQQVGQRHAGVEQLGDRRGGAKTVQQARQGEEQHKAIHAGYRLQWQHAPAGGNVAAQHQREERKGDDQNL